MSNATRAAVWAWATTGMAETMAVVASNKHAPMRGAQVLIIGFAPASLIAVIGVSQGKTGGAGKTPIEI